MRNSGSLFSDNLGCLIVLLTWLQKECAKRDFQVIEMDREVSSTQNNLPF